MRVFLCLLSIAAVAVAKPQYNYGSGVSGSFGGSSSGVGAIDIRGFFGNGNSGLSSGASFGSGVTSSQLYSSNIHQFSQGGGSQQTGGFEAPFVHKQFISVSAPEDNENLERTKHLIIGRPQSNYRVVFIKAPSSSKANVKLSAEYAPQEEKTVIYVLTKKDSSLEVGDIATPAPSVPSKPEVFFIKYKTEEEAQHAQRQIQAEYDKIEGSSEHTDAGVAPQQSVIGIFGNGSGSGSYGSAGSGNFATGVSSSAGKASAYLPPSA